MMILGGRGLRRITQGVWRVGKDVAVHAECTVLRGCLGIGRCLEGGVVVVHWIDVGEGMHRLLGIGRHSAMATRCLIALNAFY